MKKILVYVQHLLGIGHLHRTALITRSLAQAGFDVTVVSGGMPEASVDFGQITFIQLEAIKTDPAFTDLYDKNDNVINQRFKQTRARALLNIADRVEPDLVLIETYPFGRRQMRFELLPLLQHLKYELKDSPVITCSIRDVIQPKSNPKRVDEIIGIVDKYFDYIFVHGDDSIIDFEHSFSDAQKFKEKLIYTGYVVKPFDGDLSGQRKKNTVLVSAGGGAVGQQIYETVIKASKDPRGEQYFWHMLVGGNFSTDEFNKLVNAQHEKLKIERNRSDFLNLLSQCSISFSQAGYNTMMDLLVTATPALVVPFEGVAEREQFIRAVKFEQLGIAKVIREKELDGGKLLEFMAQVSIDNETNQQIKLDGAAKMAEILHRKILI